MGLLMAPAGHGTEFRTVYPLRGICGLGGGVDPVGVSGVLGEGKGREGEGRICREDKSTTYIDKVEDSRVSRGSVLDRMGPSVYVGSLMSC